MQAKEFQQKALDRLDLYLEKLIIGKGRADRLEEVRRQNPDVDIPALDFTTEAWNAMMAAGEVGRIRPYSPREDAIGRPVPSITLKVPTGGGKTFLAVHSVARILETYFAKGSERFVLWLVPSEAIYTQTKRALTDREHPFRKTLEIASGGAVRIMEKDTPFHREDLNGHLTVMLLMLPSANRQTKEALRMFRDRGDVNGFMPPEDDAAQHAALKASVPNLDIVQQAEAFGDEAAGIVRSSLGNALRMLRPLIVLDEEQKGFSELAHDTLFGFNPRFVLGLSATPKDNDKQGRHANWLVAVSGEELEREEMIKMPILLTVHPEPSWKGCLESAWQKVLSLQHAADALEANEQRYIRPILLVQVERTGADQRTEGYIHALDAKEHLISLGLAEDAIAIKTSEQDDLKDLHLLERSCQIRAIITKSALQEGWDCPFAYVLCSLAAARSPSAMTQLIGRILRQPETSKTGVEALDQCYVFTHHENTAVVVAEVKRALEDEGMADLAGRVHDSSSAPAEVVLRERREPYRRREFYLPKVMVYEGGESAREADWEADIVQQIPWESITIAPPEGGLELAEAQKRGGEVAVDLRILAGASPTVLSTESGTGEFDAMLAARILAEHIPNPWIAHSLVEAYLSQLDQAVWTSEALAQHQAFVIGEMKRAALRVIDTAAERVFDEALAEGRLVFQLVAERWWSNWEVPHTHLGAGSTRLNHFDGSPLERDLFHPTMSGELNRLELKVACFLDRQSVIAWWFKNVVKGSGYGLQGWRKNRIYPDLIVAQELSEGGERWLVLETKGDHLSANLDTAYKAKVLERLTLAYTLPPPSIGQLTLFERRVAYRCNLVAEDGWEQSVRGLLAPGEPATEPTPG